MLFIIFAFIFFIIYGIVRYASSHEIIFDIKVIIPIPILFCFQMRYRLYPLSNSIAFLLCSLKIIILQRLLPLNFQQQEDFIDFQFYLWNLKILLLWVHQQKQFPSILSVLENYYLHCSLLSQPHLKRSVYHCFLGYFLHLLFSSKLFQWQLL